MFLGASHHIFKRAEELRLNETPTEKMLWSKLKRKQLGVKFRRQHPILSYVVDFYCYSHGLVIELDGEIHQTKENRLYDQLRTKDLEENGLRVLRFENDRVIHQIDKVLTEIMAAIALSPGTPKGEVGDPT
jgi:cyclase